MRLFHQLFNGKGSSNRSTQQLSCGLQIIKRVDWILLMHGAHVALLLPVKQMYQGLQMELKYVIHRTHILSLF